MSKRVEKSSEVREGIVPNVVAFIELDMHIE